jgi:hypothetical protein
MMNGNRSIEGTTMRSKLFLVSALALPFAAACGSGDVAPASSGRPLPATGAAQTQPPERSPTPEPPSPQPERPPPTAALALQASPIAPSRTAAAAAPTAPGAAAPTPLGPTLAKMVEAAKADLAQRRSIAPDAISVVEVRAVTWPNPGLGCPQPGMEYKQVPVDGLLIRFEAAGRIFEYHGGGGKPPFLCEQPRK